MKHLIIQNTHYHHLELGFKEWLQTLGYAEGTVKTFPIHVHEFLYYLEQNNLTHITQVKPRHVGGFIYHLKYRSNKRFGGALSISSINKTIQAINTFATYINQTGTYLLDITSKRFSNEIDERTVLTQTEIKQLYEATFTAHRENTIAIGQRDRVIIAIFYGCGLRKDEGIKLNIADIDLIKKTVFVKKGKGNKQRYVPIANKHAEDIRAYIEQGRYWFLEDHSQSNYYNTRGKPIPKKNNPDNEALFLNQGGKRMQSFYKRFNYLKEQTGIQKQFSTHNLRHSIATHLLQNGMSIEEISKFLGHSSLDSTQIYTHIVNQLKHKENEHTEFLLLSEE